MIHVVFDLQSYWHAGTGKGLGTLADAVVARSPAGLPYLPGRAVKGLLRRACAQAESFGQLPEGRTARLFGTELAASRHESDAAIDEAFEEARFTTVPGILRFESATLGEAWEAWGRANPAGREKASLFHRIASTAVADRGVVKAHTLRTIEVAVPVRLRAPVTCLDQDADWVEHLRHAAPLIRGLGAHRNRGLGRVAVTVEEVR